MNGGHSADDVLDRAARMQGPTSGGTTPPPDEVQRQPAHATHPSPPSSWGGRTPQRPQRRPPARSPRRRAARAFGFILIAVGALILVASVALFLYAKFVAGV